MMRRGKAGETWKPEIWIQCQGWTTPLSRHGLASGSVVSRGALLCRNAIVPVRALFPLPRSSRAEIWLEWVHKRRPRGVMRPASGGIRCRGGGDQDARGCSGVPCRVTHSVGELGGVCGSGAASGWSCGWRTASGGERHRQWPRGEMVRSETAWDSCGCVACVSRRSAGHVKYDRKIVSVPSEQLLRWGGCFLIRISRSVDWLHVSL
ncbi:hypothetical protein EV126DRAFT_194016 [Verticillium dahliae]|nr:hypothetical protein EV126DRAFT_194016 [Verticillium dahliae]